MTSTGVCTPIAVSAHADDAAEPTFRRVHREVQRDDASLHVAQQEDAPCGPAESLERRQQRAQAPPGLGEKIGAGKQHFALGIKRLEPHGAVEAGRQRARCSQSECAGLGQSHRRSEARKRHRRVAETVKQEQQIPCALWALHPLAASEARCGQLSVRRSTRQSFLCPDPGTAAARCAVSCREAAAADRHGVRLRPRQSFGRHVPLRY
eukprot:3868383-Prymnesium_polylepis.2